MRMRIKAAGLLFAILAASACSQGIGTGSEIQRGPVGVGTGVNELKGTPCACTEIPMKFPSDMV